MAKEHSPQSRQRRSSPLVVLGALFDTLPRVYRAQLAIVASCMTLGSVLWQIRHPDLVYGLLLRADSFGVTVQQRLERQELDHTLWVFLAVAVVLAVGMMELERRGKPLPRPSHLCLPNALVVAPAVIVTGFEYEHPILTGCMVLVAGALVAWAVADTPRLVAWWSNLELTPRVSWIVLAALISIFVVGMGWLAHVRLLALRAQWGDFCWEISALSGLARHGVPTINITPGDLFEKPLPIVYFWNHVPLVYYLWAPFYWMIPHPATAVWSQAITMGVGALGVYLAAGRWFKHRPLALVWAFVYLAMPHIQGYCLHDFHANYLAIPFVMLALGFMETKRTALALVMAAIAIVAREETGLYVAGLGAFWLFTRRSRAQRWAGVATIAASVAWVLFVAGWLMPHFGGHSSIRHAAFFFDARSSMGVLKAVFLNPLGLLLTTAQAPQRLEYLWLTLLAVGGLAIFGYRGLWFLPGALLLLLSSDNVDFYVVGLNYGAPVVVPALVMGLCGGREWLVGWCRNGRHLPRRRAALSSFLLVVAGLTSHFYGNLGSKTVKFDYGAVNYGSSYLVPHGRQGYSFTRPPVGKRERAIWDARRHVPSDATVSTSALLCPVFGDRKISYLLSEFGDRSPRPQERAGYVALQKHATIAENVEPNIDQLRHDRRWKVHFEDRYIVIFKRK